MPPSMSLTRETQHLDGAHDLHRPDGRIWRYDAADRLLDIVDADGAVTVFEPDGATLHFDAQGDLVWADGGIAGTKALRQAA